MARDRGAMKRGSLNPIDHVGPDGKLPVRVSPGASAERLIPGDPMRVAVTTVPEGGKATKAVIALLARAFGLPKSAVILVRGETSRDKVFRIEHGD